MLNFHSHSRILRSTFTRCDPWLCDILETVLSCTTLQQCSEPKQGSAHNTQTHSLHTHPSIRSVTSG